MLHGVPSCPEYSADEDDEAGTSDASSLVAARQQLQQWLLSVLMFPGARESPAIRMFLTDAANIIPPQYENATWTMFDASGQVLNLAAAASPSSAPQQASAPAPGSEFTMDMMMDDWADDGGASGQLAEFDEQENEYRASERYKPTDEPVSEEDKMEMANMAAEVEMIEDVGSLAQSLGASHIGRSLMLQGKMGVSHMYHGAIQQHQHGIFVGTAASGVGGGGIGNAMENATHGLGSSFNQTLPESPPRLDSFKMIKVIGKGSFGKSLSGCYLLIFCFLSVLSHLVLSTWMTGKVFLVKEKKTGQMYALKVLKKDNIIKRNQVEHTKTERSVLGYVRHPFIVGMNMAFQSKDKLFFVLDYCAGGELFFHLGKLGTFPEDRARFYAAEIILAISYVHSLDIIYRDLKPENVLIDAAGHIRLTDFGLSKEGISNSAAGANSFCGTPEYLAPEILNRQGHGRAVDWWSLGALLYEMLTGLPPFYTQDREILFEKIRNSELPYPPSLSPNAKGLLRGLLTKDPERRLGSGPGDAQDIQRHIFFSPVDWEKLMRGEIAPPWKPQIANSTDTSQFDQEFTSMPIFSPQSMRRAPGFGTTPSNDNPFDGFTFQDRGFHAPAQQAGN